MKVASWSAMRIRLEEEARKFLMEAYGLELTVPVEVNGRLKSTYGRFVYQPRGRQPLRIEMGKNYIEHQEWKTIYETLKHECIHYALFVLGKPHRDGHPVFEAELQKHDSHSTGTVQYRGKVVQYGCPCCNAVFTKKRRYKNNGLGYRCRKCQEQIVFLGEKVI
jgi:SprT-like protein